MPSACMAEIESHLIRCALPIQMPATTLARLALLIIIGILRSVVCSATCYGSSRGNHYDVPASAIQSWVRREKVRGQVPFGRCRLRSAQKCCQEVTDASSPARHPL